MNINFRKIEEKDFNQIIELITEFAEYEKRPDRMFNSEARMHSEKEYFNAFVAETDGNQIIGYLTYFICYFTWIGKSFYIDDFYVKPEYRRLGIGNKLFENAKEMAIEKKCHKMRWQVSKWNDKAIDLYKKIGADIEDIELDCDLLLDQ